VSEELGKIEKPSVEDFKAGRKLFFIPLIFPNQELPEEFQEKYNRYWEQADTQVDNLETKLGPVNRIYHELVPEKGEEAALTLATLKAGSLRIIRKRMEKGASFESTENSDLLSELMDWSRCLSLGLQNKDVFSKVYGFYSEANNKRQEHISKEINDTLKENEIGILIMAEGHHVQFQPDIRIFYISPPALDEIKRWLRDFEAKANEAAAKDNASEPVDNTPVNQEKSAGQE
jgi:hypothetical protein